jgi:hypothetical protein
MDTLAAIQTKFLKPTFKIPGPSLGYNLAVNTAMHAHVAAATASAARPGSHMQASPRSSLTGQGNCQPGYPVRPSESHQGNTNNSLNSNVIGEAQQQQQSEGHPGHQNRTDYSPDTTTKDIPTHYSVQSCGTGTTPQGQQAAAEQQQTPSFLVYKAGDVPMTGPVVSKPLNPLNPLIKKPKRKYVRRKQLPLVRTAPAAPEIPQQQVNPTVVAGITKSNDYEPEQQICVPVKPVNPVKQQQPIPAKQEEFNQLPWLIPNREQQQRLSRVMGQGNYTPKEKMNDLPSIPNSTTDHGPQFESDEKNEEIKEKLLKNVKDEAPTCKCFPPDAIPPDVGPYYTHLGVASSLVHLRAMMEDRCNVTGPKLRIVKARYCNKEGRSETGCPIAKYVVRRMTNEEKFLVIAKNRVGHR